MKSPFHNLLSPFDLPSNIVYFHDWRYVNPGAYVIASGVTVGHVPTGNGTITTRGGKGWLNLNGGSMYFPANGVCRIWLGNYQGGMGVFNALKGEVKGTPIVAGDERVADLGGGEALRDELV